VVTFRTETGCAVLADGADSRRWRNFDRLGLELSSDWAIVVEWRRPGIAESPAATGPRAWGVLGFAGGAHVLGHEQIERIIPSPDLVWPWRSSPCRSAVGRMEDLDGTLGAFPLWVGQHLAMGAVVLRAREHGGACPKTAAFARGPTLELQPEFVLGGRTSREHLGPPNVPTAKKLVRHWDRARGGCREGAAAAGHDTNACPGGGGIVNRCDTRARGSPCRAREGLGPSR